MAERTGTASPSRGETSTTISQLRSVAQQHLDTINQEKIQEQKDETKKVQDLERYAKPRRGGKGSASRSPSDTSQSRMRTAQDVLHRLQWDTDLDISKYLVGYLERFDGIKEMPACNWIPESTEEEWIPQHRVKYFKKRGGSGEYEIVWDRESRVDMIFGTSTRSLTNSGNVEADVLSEDGGAALPQ